MFKPVIAGLVDVPNPVDVSGFATAEQGELAQSALQPNGDGSQLTNLPGYQLNIGGTITNATIGRMLYVGEDAGSILNEESAITTDGNGHLTATSFTGDGSGLTGIPILVTDTGWTANADNGNKTAAIPIQASASAAIAALDPTSALGLAALFAYYTAAAEKTKALEFALANSLKPNA